MSALIWFVQRISEASALQVLTLPAPHSTSVMIVVSQRNARITLLECTSDEWQTFASAIWYWALVLPYRPSKYATWIVVTWIVSDVRLKWQTEWFNIFFCCCWYLLHISHVCRKMFLVCFLKLWLASIMTQIPCITNLKVWSLCVLLWEPHKETMTFTPVTNLFCDSMP